ncbi:MAG: glyoxalase [Ferruginibacter sp.]|nr:glyoxalase [Ferruginibacter sp.]
MNSKKIWANLAVDDLERTTKFYSDLGFKSNGRSKDLTSFFFGDDQFIIHFFLKKVLQQNVKGELSDLSRGNEIVFTLSAETKEEVDAWEQEVGKAGGSIVSPPEAFGQGYYGFVFKDPDGHKFNVFFM